MSKSKPRYSMIVIQAGWEHDACANCGDPFESTRRDAQHCSARCRYKASDTRKKARRDLAAQMLAGIQHQESSNDRAGEARGSA